MVMFEKEAKERARKIEENQTLGVYDSDEDYARDSGWNDGEVVGYEEGFKDGAEFAYNEANKWHYIKDGDLPKKENLECLCIIRPMKEEGESFENKDFRGVLYFRSGRFYLDEDNCNDCFKETNSDFTDIVIAWKEIVLPELN